MSKKVCILGSTGSIGVSTLDIIRLHSKDFQVESLVAGSRLDLLLPQIKEFKVQKVAVKSEKEKEELHRLLVQENLKVTLFVGTEGAVQLASDPAVDVVVSAIVGAAGLRPTMAALEAGKKVCLANKESMVIAGELMQDAKKRGKAEIVPVDSEHSAIFQCLQGTNPQDVIRLILTASGGPFLKRDKKDFIHITKAEALAHPNWVMGKKITIDSATMMNKGLEVMEAQWLFGFDTSKVDIVVHPQSVIHSMIETADHSVLAQLGTPDMKGPIAYALSYPRRIQTNMEPLNFFKMNSLTFFEPDFEKFPALPLAYKVAQAKKTYPAVLNAANEVAVDAFLEDKISFVQIIETVQDVVEAHEGRALQTLEDILIADRWARDKCNQILSKRN